MKRSIYFFVIFLLFLTACNKNADVVEEAEEETNVEEQSEDAVDSSTTPLNFFPLTGIGTDEEINQRPYGVIINNHPDARPQSGLHKADIVYEVLAEGDVTRFLAIFQSEKPEIIGPVRSARGYYVDLSKGYDAFFVAHGWSPEAKEMLEGNVVDNINGMIYDGSLFWRDHSRVAPHNSYISYENIQKGADQIGKTMSQTVNGLSFLSEEEANQLQGTNAEEVRVSYASRDTFTSIYKYNEATNKYDRYDSHGQTIDRETSQPISLDNVFIVEMDHRVIDNAGRRIIDHTSGGKGLLLQKGLVQEVEWQNQNGRIIPVVDGKQVGLVPGQTWINVIPTTPGIAGSISFGK